MTRARDRGPPEGVDDGVPKKNAMVADAGIMGSVNRLLRLGDDVSSPEKKEDSKEPKALTGNKEGRKRRARGKALCALVTAACVTGCASP